MKRMKKLVSIVLAGAVVFGACACNKSDSSKSRRDNDDDLWDI